MSELSQLRKLAKASGLTVKECGNGHVQIMGGPVLVNYWPDSKRRTVYIGSTKGGIYGATPERVIQMASEKPKVINSAPARKRSYRADKVKMLRKQKTCHWCGKQVSIDGEVEGTLKATLDHIIPLKRGGLDNPNNYTLACESCNSERGHDMPEMGGGE